MKKTVVAALIVESTASYHVSIVTGWPASIEYGQTDDAAMRKTSRPGRLCGNVGSPLTTGRNHAAA